MTMRGKEVIAFSVIAHRLNHPALTFKIVRFNVNGFL